MKVTLIGIESIEGVSKKNGREYAIYTLRATAPVPLSQQEKKTPDYIRKKQGQQLIEQQVNEILFRKVQDISASYGLPCAVDLRFEENISSNGQIYQECIDIEVDEYSQVEAAG